MIFDGRQNVLGPRSLMSSMLIKDWRTRRKES